MFRMALKNRVPFSGANLQYKLYIRMQIYNIF